VSIAFGVFTPISLTVSMVVGEMSGGPFGAIGAFAGALLVTAFLTVFVCALVLQVTKLATDVEKNEKVNFR
jgi:predicted permease